MRRVIVADTGPLLHLSEAGAIHLLPLAGDVLIPALVALEFESNAQGWKPPQWAKILDLDEVTRDRVSVWVRKGQVDAGEADAIGLALREKAQWFLTDDAVARQFAESLGLEVHGSIGLLLWSVAAGHAGERQEALKMLNDLGRSSLWVSKRVLLEAQKAIDTLFASDS